MKRFDPLARELIATKQLRLSLMIGMMISRTVFSLINAASSRIIKLPPIPRSLLRMSVSMHAKKRKSLCRGVSFGILGRKGVRGLGGGDGIRCRPVVVVVSLEGVSFG